MKLNKITIYFVLGLLLIVFVNSSPSQINILNMEYNYGNIELIEKTTKIGYYPDRIDQPDSGHNLSIYSVSDENLYSFRFVPPFVEFTDGFDEDKNIGKILIRDNFNFSLIVPSYTNEKRIVIYDNEKNEIGMFDLIEKSSKTTDNTILIVILISISFLLFIFIKNYRKSKK